MKPILKSIFVFLISAFSIYSCQKAPALLTESEKEAISNEVKTAFKQMNAMMNSHNVDEMMKLYVDDDDFIYAASGNLYTKLGDLRESVGRVHSNPMLLPFTVTFNEIKIRVLERDLTMLSGLGLVKSSIGSEQEKSLQIVITFLMKKTEGQWMIISGHESTKEIVF